MEILPDTPIPARAHQVCALLDDLSAALKARALTAILSTPPPPALPPTAAGSVASLATPVALLEARGPGARAATTHAKSGATHASSTGPGASAAEVAKQSAQRVHAITQLAMALASWGDEAEARQAGSTRQQPDSSTPCGSGGGNGQGGGAHVRGRSGPRGQPHAVEAVRVALLAAQSAGGATKGGGGDLVSAVCTLALGPVQGAISSDALAPDKDAPSPRMPLHSPPLLSLEAAVAAIRESSAIFSASQILPPARVASASVGCSQAIAALGALLVRHTSATTRSMQLGFMQGGSATTLAHGATHAASTSTAGSSAGGSYAAAWPSAAGPSRPMDAQASDGASTHSHAPSMAVGLDGILSSGALSDALGALLVAEASGRRWEATTRHLAHSTQAAAGSRRRASAPGESNAAGRGGGGSVLSGGGGGAAAAGVGGGCARRSDAEDGEGSDVEGEVPTASLRFPPLEQEECSLMMRAAMLRLMHSLVSAMLEQRAGLPTSSMLPLPPEAREVIQPPQDLNSPEHRPIPAAPAEQPCSSADMFDHLLRAFEADVQAGIPIPLLHAHLSLLQLLSRHCRRTTADRAARAACRVLQSYTIENTVAIRALLTMAFSCFQDEPTGMHLAADTLLAALGGLTSPSSASRTMEEPVANRAIGSADDEASTGLSGERSVASPRACLHDDATPSIERDAAASTGAAGHAKVARMNLCASLTTRTAAIQCALAYWKRQLALICANLLAAPDAAAQKLACLATSLDRGMHPIFDCSEAAKARGGRGGKHKASETASQPAVVSRILGIVNGLLTATNRLAGAMLSIVSGADGGSTIAARCVGVGAAGAGLGAAASRTGAAACPTGLSTCHTKQTILEVWVRACHSLAPFISAYASWLRRASISWTVQCRRRVPASLYACERATLSLLSTFDTAAGAAHKRVDPACARLLQNLRREWSAHDARTTAPKASPSDEAGSKRHRNGSDRHAQAPQQKRGATNSSGRNRGDRSALSTQGGVAAEGDDDSDDESVVGENERASDDDGGRSGEEEEDVGLTLVQSSSRQKLRSRNPFIDAELARGRTNDSYADLEDFIVCKRGRKYD